MCSKMMLVSVVPIHFQDLQEEFVKRFAVLSEEIRDAGSVEAREEMMTEADMEMAEQAHGLALALYRYFVYGENSGLIKGIG